MTLPVAASPIKLPLAAAIYDRRDQDHTRRLIELAFNQFSQIQNDPTVGISVKETDVLVATGVTALDFLGTEFVLSESPVGEVNISLESRIARLDTPQTWTAQQTFAASIVSAGGVIIDGATAKITINGADGTVAPGSVGIAENNSTLILSTLGSMQFIIDNNSDQTNATFAWLTNNNISLMTLSEVGTLTVATILATTLNGTLATVSQPNININANQIVGGTLLTARGGTGVSSPTLGNLLVGAGTAAMTLLAPGAAGGVVVSDGTSWVRGTGVPAGPHTHDAADIISGTFADARIAQSNVTQHQAALILSAAQITSGIFPVAQGGTGLASVTVGNLLLGAGTAALTLLAPGAVGGFVRSDGAAWVRGTIQATDIPAHTHSAADITSGNLAYARLPTGGGTWANGGALSITGGVTTVAGLISGAIQLDAATAKISIDGADGVVAPGAIGIAENGAELQLSTRGSMLFGIDNSNTLTDRVFRWITNNGLELLRLDEAGQFSFLTGLFKSLVVAGPGLYLIASSSGTVADQGGLLLNNNPTTPARHWKQVATFTGAPGTASRYRAGWVTDADKETWLNTGPVLSVSGAGVVSFTGDVNGITSLTATSIAGTLTTAAQPNITSVGTLTSLAVTGGITAASLTATSITGTLLTAAQPNITSLGTLTGLSISVTTLITNLNADLLDGQHGAFYLDLANATGTLPGGSLPAHTHPFSAITGTLAYAQLPTGGGTWANGGALSITGGVVSLVGLTVNANLATFIAAAGNFDLNISRPAAQTGGINFQTAGVARWGIYVTEAVESGADTGSSFRLRARTDAGAFIDDPITIARVAGAAIALGASGRSTQFGVGGGVTIDGTTAKITLDGVDATVVPGSIGVFESGGGLRFSSRSSIIAILDNDNNQTSTFEVWRDNGAQAVLVMSETGALTVTLSISAPSIAGTLTTAAQPNITSVGTLTSLAVTGGISAASIAVTSTVLVTNLNADFLDGQHGAFYLDRANHTGAVPAPPAHTHSAADIVSGNLAYARLPTGGGTWANGGVLAITGGALTLEAGSAAAPSFSFTADPDTGLYNFGANEVGIAQGGVAIARFTGRLVELYGRVMVEKGDSSVRGRVPVVSERFGIVNNVAFGAFATAYSFQVGSSILGQLNDGIVIKSEGIATVQQGQVRLTVAGTLVFTSGNISVNQLWTLEAYVIRTGATTYTAIITWHQGASNAEWSTNRTVRATGTVADWSSSRVVNVDTQPNASGGVLTSDYATGILISNIP